MLAPCHHAGFLAQPMPALDDAEGARVPTSLPPVVDAHVHVFSDGMFEAIWRWFDAHGWPVRYRLFARDVIDFLLSRGVEHAVLLHYAHEPGIARADIQRRILGRVVDVLRHPSRLEPRLFERLEDVGTD